MRPPLPLLPCYHSHRLQKVFIYFFFFVYLLIFQALTFILWRDQIRCALKSETPCICGDNCKTMRVDDGYDVGLRFFALPFSGAYIFICICVILSFQLQRHVGGASHDFSCTCGTRRSLRLRPEPGISRPQALRSTDWANGLHMVNALKWTTGADFTSRFRIRRSPSISVPAKTATLFKWYVNDLSSWRYEVPIAVLSEADHLLPTNASVANVIRAPF